MTDSSSKRRRSQQISTAVTRVLIVIAVALVCAVGTAATGFAPGAELPWQVAASHR